MSVEEALEGLRRDPRFMENVSAWERLPPRPAAYAGFPDRLNPRLAAAVRRLGIPELFVHQAEAVRAALEGDNLAVVTGTASGKTLCYNLPVLQDLLADPEGRALYLFPTKALAQDQAAALGDLLGALDAAEQIPVRTYDGDTPSSERPAIREAARILISNPDMLHTGILPHHPRWASLFANLRWVVLDELHVYRGVFGSNVANLLRRLKRICKFYEAEPRFALTSATIANPKELAEKLIEAPVRLISPDLDGSPRAEKHVILYNPPVIEPKLGIRRAYTLEAARIAERFLQAGVQTAVFARARVTTELLLGYVRDGHQSGGGDPGAIRGYRGGYLPRERPQINPGLPAAHVVGGVATNALELGGDIGQLGAAVLVASAAPLDQFVAANPRYLFEQPPEHGLINPDNLAILVRHLRCAAFELPFQEGEPFGSYTRAQELLLVLAEQGELHSSGGAYRWVSDSYPAEGVSLRASSDDTVVIQ